MIIDFIENSRYKELLGILAFVYANGTDSTGHLNQAGKDLLKEMDRLGMILDAIHLCDEAFWDALDLYQGKSQ